MITVIITITKTTTIIIIIIIIVMVMLIVIAIAIAQESPYYSWFERWLKPSVHYASVRHDVSKSPVGLGIPPFEINIQLEICEAWQNRYD